MSVSRMMETEFLHELTRGDLSLNLLGLFGSILGFERGILVSFHHLLGKQMRCAPMLILELLSFLSLSFDSHFISPVY